MSVDLTGAGRVLQETDCNIGCVRHRAGLAGCLVCGRKEHGSGVWRVHVTSVSGHAACLRCVQQRAWSVPTRRTTATSSSQAGACYWAETVITSPDQQRPEPTCFGHHIQHVMLLAGAAATLLLLVNGEAALILLRQRHHAHNVRAVALPLLLLLLSVPVRRCCEAAGCLQLCWAVAGARLCVVAAGEEQQLGCWLKGCPPTHPSCCWRGGPGCCWMQAAAQHHRYC